MNKSNRLGEENYNNKGTLMKIVDYIDSTKKNNFIWRWFN